MKRVKAITGRLFIVTVIIISIIVTVSGGCAKKPEKVRVGYLPITLTLPFFVAMEKGYFTEAGLKVEAIKGSV
ncbi:MAG: ABC transporter substrate-binding protein [candidate division Zixibacteria bacterium]|nr:ABC transporter substrate-binding protein [candidate division Zixibacteria bacterium]MCK4428473.1 ABC transporter substrate-binding protein [candidate division Zixibacteria bacterium]